MSTQHHTSAEDNLRVWESLALNTEREKVTGPTREGHSLQHLYPTECFPFQATQGSTNGWRRPVVVWTPSQTLQNTANSGKTEKDKTTLDSMKGFLNLVAARRRPPPFSEQTPASSACKHKLSTARLRIIFDPISPD